MKPAHEFLATTGIRNATFKRIEWNNSIKLKFDGPLTYKMLAAVAEYFGSDAIDIEGRHGEGSYDVGLEVELTIYNATKNVLSGST